MKAQPFMAFDYGTIDLNRKVYQTPGPPEYRLSQVPATVPVFVLYGGNDRLSTPADVSYMMSQLPLQPKVLFNPQYAHLDYLLSSKMMQDVNFPLLAFVGQNAALRK
jgi:lysosomal acid lipase/cholesteryl ester hydrolase